MAGFRLVLSTHASLPPVCKAPVSTSALYQPLFESHTSNNLTFLPFLPSVYVEAFVLEREPSVFALICCTYFYRQTFTCFKGLLSAIHFVFAKLKARVHRQARGALRKLF